MLLVRYSAIPGGGSSPTVTEDYFSLPTVGLLRGSTSFSYFWRSPC